MSVQPYIPDNELSAWHSPCPLAAQINPLLTHSAPLLKQTDWILLPFDCLVGGSSAGWQAPDTVLLEVTQSGMQAPMDSLCTVPEGRTFLWSREPQAGVLDTTCSHPSSQLLGPSNIPEHGTDGGHAEKINEGKE